MTDLVLAALFVMMIMTALAAIRLTDLFAVVIMFSIYSLLAASMFVVMDAVDVALTEAAVDAGIATILMLATLVLTDRWERPSARLRMVPLAVVCLTGAVLLYGTLDMPIFGDASSPANTHLATYYLTESPGEVGLPNVVTSVLASYRAYDTLGEVAVIFTAGVGVLALLGAARSGRGGAAPMRDNPVPRVIAKIMIPLIILFALYVQLHGDFGPGGGFQAGVIFAAAIILYAIVFGVDAAAQVIPPAGLKVMMTGGVLLFAGTGFVTMALGGAFLDYDVLARDPLAGQHLGIVLVELGIGITVAAVVISVFLAFAGRRRAR